jgi:hypothetical protein
MRRPQVACAPKIPAWLLHSSARLPMSESGTQERIMGSLKTISGTKFSVVIICIVAIGAAIAAFAASSKRAAPAGPSIGTVPETGSVHGSVYTKLNNQIVLLTDFPVFLKDVATNVQGVPQKTDRHGHYILRSQVNGDYQLCWSAPGWTPGCRRELVRVRGNISYLPDQPVTPLTGTPGTDGSGAPIWGRVKLADGSSPYFFDPYFGVKQDVKVTVKVGSTITTVFTNALGEFVVPFVPFSAGSVYQATASVSGASMTVGGALGQGNPITLQLRNKRPTVAGIVARLAGAARHEVPVNSVLNVAADLRDPDGDALSVVWKTAPLNGAITSSVGPNAVWELNSRPGIMVLYALVNDGKGGISTGNVSVSAGASAAYFGVRLVDAVTGAIVPNAVVTVNGVMATASPQGVFVARAPIATRYIVNASAPDYIFFSRIYNRSGVFHEVKLVRPALSSGNDPNGPIVLVDTRQDLRKYGYCEGMPSRITIKPGTLVGPDKKKLTAKLRGEIGALDITSEQFPGENAAMVNGVDVGLVSYGSVHVELRDPAGNRAQLADGATAEVVIPIPCMRTSQVPQTVPLWYYDEQTGYWKKFSKPAVYDPTKHAYTGEVTHLSAYNVDLEQDDLACFRVLLDNVNTGLLRASVESVSGQAFTPTDLFPIHDKLNVIKRLPPNSTVRLTVTNNSGDAVGNLALFDETEVQVGTPGVEGGVATFADLDTGPPTLPHFPEQPYANCKTVSVRVVGNGVTSVATNQYLTFYSGIGDIGSTQDYYTTLDPGLTPSGDTYTGGDRSTLGDWWTQVAGFSNTGTAADEAHESYLNFNDLGFGRDMHIREEAGKVYAYVTNYANSAVPDQNPLNAVYARDHVDDKIIATVAMEASDFAGLSHVVKFFVYGGGDATAPLINSADLDGFGQKFVPQLCQVCHGGKPFFSSSGATDLDYALRSADDAVGAVLREFDLGTFVFPGDSVPGALPADISQYYELNQLVKASGTQQAIETLIDGFNPNSTTFDAAWAPASWSDLGPGPKRDLYTDVVGKSCRTCHIAFDPTDAFMNTLNWENYTNFTNARFSINFRVCTPNSQPMPHALMTYRNFWLGGLGGPYEPQVLRTYSDGAAWPVLGTCQ